MTLDLDFAQLLFAALGTIGFCLLYQVPKRFIPLAALGAICGWFVYSLVRALGGGEMFANFLAAATVASYAELMSRRCKTPATIFLVPGVLTIVPGGGIYLTMRYLVDRDLTAALWQGLETLGISLAIAFGILLVSTIGQVLRRLAMKRKTKHETQ